jgi:bifunctional non-homologous end joining protein LigD
MHFPPMLALATPALPTGEGWRYEPKYDGMRLLALVTATVIRLLSREGNDKARQFPEVVAALARLREAVGADFVLDCELVALASDGYAGFQALLSRINLEKSFRIRLLAEARPAALVAFDLLVLGSRPLLSRPLAARRQALATLLAGRTGPQIRLARHGRNGQRMLAYAVRRNLEGVVAKREDSPYQPDQRSALWLKYKLARRQEFVVGGYTDSPRRAHFRALLLGCYDGDTLVYAGSVGAGFSRRSLAECHARLSALEPAFCPFGQVPDGNDPVHWTRPEVVVEVTFEQWPSDGKLRNPRFAGMRTDKRARAVVREDTGP